MNKLVRFILNFTTLALFLFAEPSSSLGQEVNSWWKNIFRSAPDTPQVIEQIVPMDSCMTIREENIEIVDSVNFIDRIEVLEKRIGMGHVQIYMDSAIMEINAKSVNNQ